MQLAAPCRACAVRSLRLRREPLRVAASNCASAKQQQLQRQREQHSSADMAYIVPVSAWMMAAAPLPAFAEDSAAAAAAETLTTPSWLGYALLLSPIVLYAIFNLYRSQVNPRAKFSDFLFICAGVAVVGNLVSIVAFKVRLF